MTVFYTAVWDGDDRSALVRRLLAHGWAMLYGGELPAIQKDGFGKPFFPGRPDVFFSLSHTNSHVLCAIGGAPVGADIQTHRPVSARLREQTTGEEERQLFDFFDLWCLKESYIKFKGRYNGLLRETCFGLESGRITAPEDGISCRVYHSIPGCTAAVCYVGEYEPRLVYVERSEI